MLVLFPSKKHKKLWLCNDFLNSLKGSTEIRIFLNYFTIKNIYK